MTKQPQTPSILVSQEEAARPLSVKRTTIIQQALLDPTNRGGAYFRWVTNQEDFLARAVASATALIGKTYTAQPNKQSPKAKTGTFTPPHWAAQALYDHIKAHPEASIRQLRQLPVFADVRYRNWFIDKLLAWCIEHKLLVRNPPQGRRVTHTALPLPGLLSTSTEAGR